MLQKKEWEEKREEGTERKGEEGWKGGRQDRRKEGNRGRNIGKEMPATWSTRGRRKEGKEEERREGERRGTLEGRKA